MIGHVVLENLSWFKLIFGGTTKIVSPKLKEN